MYHAQYSAGITTLMFLDCMRDKFCVAPRRQHFQKMINLQQRSWLTFYTGDRHTGDRLFTRIHFLSMIWDGVVLYIASQEQRLTIFYTILSG